MAAEYVAAAELLPLGSVELPQAASVAGGVPAVESLHESILEVTLDAQSDRRALIVLRDAAGTLWLAEEDLVAMRLRVPVAKGVVHDNRRYVPLAAFAGATSAIDEAAQRLALSLPAAAFQQSRISAAAAASQPLTPAAPGAFLNYQLSAQRVAQERHLGAFGELGLFNRFGVLTSTAVATRASTERRVQRLETSFTRDFPDSLRTLVVGDAISDGASWGNSLRYAGVRLGRNFALRPDLVTLPTLSTSGTAVVPSTVDVFVNNQRVVSQDVSPGTFVIDRLPAMTGSGEMRVVVRDALGREQVVTQSFYASNRLLAAGLSQYSLSLGRIRQNYARSGDGYGSWLGTASYKRAVRTSLTLEAHAESLRGEANAAGLNAAFALDGAGIANMTLARGGNGVGSGWLKGVGYERLGRRLSFALATTVVDAAYRQVGDTSLTGTRYRQRNLAQIGFGLGRAGSLALAYAQQFYDGQPALRTLSVSQNLVLRQRAAVNLTISRSNGAEQSTSAYLAFTLAFAPRRSVSLQATAGSGSSAPPGEIYATVQQNAPAGPGLGYRIGAGTHGNYDAAWRAQTVAGDLDVQSVRSQGVAGQSALWSGAATLLGGQVRATRAVNGSFALVDVGGIPDIPVYIDHQLVAHTDRHGQALLHDLRAFEANRINVEPLELPLDARIDARTVVLAPAWRSGVVARFPVVREHGATFRLLQADGRVVPAGAAAEVTGQTLTVAFDGLGFVPHYEGAARGVAQWGAQRCEFHLPGLGSSDPLPDLGTVRCVAPTR